MRLRLLPIALFLACAAWARAGEPPLGDPPVPPPFTEEVAFLGFSGARVAAASTRSAELEGLGATWVQTEAVRWDAVQPQPPVAGRTLSDWSALDATVVGWQRGGFAPVLVLSPASVWASQPLEETDWARFARERLPSADATLLVRTARGASPPRREHWKAWQAFVEAVVERYDADGKADAPGLEGRLREVQVLDRVQDGDHWLGSAEDYLRLLHHAAEGAEAADPRCEVVHAAVDLRGLFRAGDDVADAWRDRLRAAIPAVPPWPLLEVERGIGIVLRSLEMPSLYRALPHLGSGSLQEDVVNLRALRDRLDARGATNVAVRLTESPARRLELPRVPLPGASRRTTADAATRARVRRVLAGPPPIEGRMPMPREADPAWLAEAQWLEEMTATDFVRGAALARAAGAARVFVDHAGGGLLHRHSVGGTPSSTWHAARQMNALLLGHRGATEAPLGGPGTAVVFSFGEKAPLPWVTVLLLDDGGPWGGEAGKPLPTKRGQVPLPPGDIEVEELALSDGAPKRRRVKIVEGILPLDLTAAPVYVFPARD